MRKALQRCSASLPRAASAHPTTSIFTRSLCRQRNAIQLPAPANRHALRSLHYASPLRQQAAAQASYSEPQTNNSHGIRITRFDELETYKIAHPNVVRTLTRDMGLETMTEVQQATINEALKGTDIIAQAKTGTGKTLAFLLPILQNIISIDPDLARPSFSRQGPRTTADDIRALIISPTRELAEQIAEEARRLVRNTGVIVQTAVGGTQKSAGLRAIQQRGCHLLVGTPGRLKDILSDPYTRVEAPDLSALVFDEADRLLDQGFWPEIQEIMRLLPTPAEKDRQTMLFSATVSQEVVDLVRSTLKPGFQFVKCVRDDEEPTHQRVQQRIVTVNGFENKLPALIELCSKAVEASKQPGGKPFKAIVYYNSTAEVTFAASALRNLQSSGSPDEPVQDAFGRRKQPHPWGSTRVYEIHARLTQSHRTAAADHFRQCASGLLLSSDVTARGMDFPNVTHVIQMALPPNREQYIHRIGRTARAGKEGEGWLIVSPEEASECRQRLTRLPLRSDKSLSTASLDLTREAQVPAEAGAILNMAQQASRSVSRDQKVKVYQALLGVYGWFGDKRALVQSMNNLAQFGWGMHEAPMVPPGVATRLGLSRIPGVRVGHEPVSVPPRSIGSFGGGGGGRGRSAGWDERSSGRDGFHDRRGAVEDRQGGFGDRRGGFEKRRGGFEDRRGGFEDRRGGFADRRGGRSSGPREVTDPFAS